MKGERRRESRRQARRSVRIPVTSSSAKAFLRSEIMNLSRGGVFLPADITLPPGTELDLLFDLPGRLEPIRAEGVVVWARNSGAGRSSCFSGHACGMGIEFQHIEAGDLDELLGAATTATGIPE